MALLASVAAMAAAVAVRTATNSWSCWLCMKRLNFESFGDLVRRIMYLKVCCPAVYPENRSDFATLLRGELCECAALALYQVMTTTKCSFKPGQGAVTESVACPVQSWDQTTGLYALTWAKCIG